MFNRRWICVWLASMCFVQAVQAANIIEGDSSKTEETFCTPIQSVAYNNLWGVASFGACTQGAKNFAISLHGQGKLKCFPIASEKTKLDNHDNVENPLYDQAISSLAFVLRPTGAIGSMDKLLLSAYMSHIPSTVYLLDGLENEGKVPILSAKEIKDATGDHVTSGVLALCGGANCSVYAAVKNNAGDDFGAIGSGIAVLTRTTTTTKSEGESHLESAFRQIDAEFSSPISAGLTRAVAFNGTLPVLKIGNDAILLNNAVDMHWDQGLNCLYIAAQVQAGSEFTDGAYALVVGSIFRGDGGEEGKLTPELFQKLQFKPIAGPWACAGSQDKIVGAIGAHALVSLHKVRTLQTSTGLNYVVVLGGNGDAASTRRTVYCLPIVNNTTTPWHGMLANKNELAYDHYQKSEPHRFNGRNFAYPALSAGDLFTANDRPAIVGGGPVIWGDVTDIWVIADAVFVAVGNADSGQLPGVAYSRAIFDETSKIVDWTAWQRVAGSIDSIYYAAMNSYTGSCLMLSGQNKQSLTVLKESSWENRLAGGLSQLTYQINNTKLPAQGGVFSVSDFSVSTPGLADISAIVATGNKCLVLAQMGQVQNGVLCPFLGERVFDSLTCANATIPVDMPSAQAHVLIFKGGALSQLGAVTTAEIACDGNNGWLFAAGVGGLAVLADIDGVSWSCADGLGDGFAGLRTGTAFKKIGDYSFVRKLISDDGFLYVLTDDRLDRINLRESNFKTECLSVATLASGHNSSLFHINSLMTDFVVSEKFALLGSSFGLFRVGDGVDIRTVPSEAAVKWTPVMLHEGSCAVGLIQVVSPTGRVQDVARTGGMAHILSSYQGNNRSQAYRFRINPIINADVGSRTLVQLGDFFVKDQPSYFVDFGGFRDWLFFDGAFFFYGTSRNQLQDPLLRLLPSVIHSGLRFAVSSSTNVPLALQSYASVMPMIRSSASGAWFLPGNFGLKINE